VRVAEYTWLDHTVDLRQILSQYVSGPYRTRRNRSESADCGTAPAVRIFRHLSAMKNDRAVAGGGMGRNGVSESNW